MCQTKWEEEVVISTYWIWPLSVDKIGSWDIAMSVCTQLFCLMNCLICSMMMMKYQRQQGYLFRFIRIFHWFSNEFVLLFESGHRASIPNPTNHSRILHRIKERKRNNKINIDQKRKPKSLMITWFITRYDRLPYSSRYKLHIIWHISSLP